MNELENGHKKSYMIQGVFGLFALCVVAIVIVAVDAHKLGKKLESAERKIMLLEIAENSKGFIDLTSKNFQTINDDLSVTINDVEQYLNGIKVSGRILNQTSTRLSTCEFTITVNGQTQHFQVNAIPSAHASRFSVVVSDVPADKARWAKISYVNGQVTYYFY